MLGAKVTYADSEDRANGNVAVNAIDGDPETFWHTQWEPVETPYPHEIRIDLQKSVSLSGLTYTPRQDMENGRIGKYEVYVSDDLTRWGKPVARGTFAAGSDSQTVPFAAPAKGRYLRFVALSELNGHRFAAIADLDVILP
jgi:hexosaminidase